MAPEDAGAQGPAPSDHGGLRPCGRGAEDWPAGSSGMRGAGGGLRAVPVLIPFAVAAVLVLSGCGNAEAEGNGDPPSSQAGSSAEGEGSEGDKPEEAEGEGQAESEEEPEPVPASSEGPAENWPEPEIPEEIYEETEEGVEAALEYWWEARTYARETGDTRFLEEGSTSDCGLCVQQVERVEETFDNDGWYVQDIVEVADSFVRMEREDYATALLSIEEGAFDTYWEGELYSEKPPEPEQGWSADFVFEDDRWRVSTMQFVGEASGSEEAGGGST